MYQLCEKRRLINSSVAGSNVESLHLTLQVYSLSFYKVFFFFFITAPTDLTQSKCAFPPPLSLFGFRLYTFEKIYYFMLCISKKSLFSAISFSSIKKKPDSALSFSAGIYVAWFQGLKTAATLLFVFLVKCFPLVCLHFYSFIYYFFAVKLLTKNYLFCGLILSWIEDVTFDVVLSDQRVFVSVGLLNQSLRCSILHPSQRVKTKLI